MARTKSSARKAPPLPTLKQLLQLKILDGLVNNNNTNNHDILYKYLKIMLSLIISGQKDREVIRIKITEFINNNQNQLELLFNELSSNSGVEISTQEKEKRIIEFIIKYGTGSIYSSKFFYEYYSIYFIDELNQQIEDGMEISDQVKDEKEDMIFYLVKDKFKDSSILASIQLIASGYFSVKALEILNDNVITTVGKVLLVATISDWSKTKNLLLTHNRLMEYFKLLFFNSDIPNSFSNSFYWADSFSKAISCGEILDFGKMESSEIIELIEFLSRNFKKNNDFTQLYFRLSSSQIKSINQVVWMWFFNNNRLFPRLSVEKATTLLTIPFEINSREFIDFIFDNYSKFRLIPQSVENSMDYDGDFEESFTTNEENVLPEFVQKFKITSLELADYFYEKLVELRNKYPLKASRIIRSDDSGDENIQDINQDLNQFKEIIDGSSEEYYEIKKYQLYYYLFIKSIKNCDIQMVKRIDELGLEFNAFKKNHEDGKYKFTEKAVIGRFPFNLDQSINTENARVCGKLKQFKLYSDKDSRKELLNYLSSTGFKSFSSSLFYKLFGRVLYRIDSVLIPIIFEANEKEKVINPLIDRVVQDLNIFSDDDIQFNQSLIDLKLNETLLYKLILNSIYRLNYPILNLLLSRFGIQINKELFSSIMLQDRKTYSFIISIHTITSHHQFDTILKIIKLLLSKLELLPNIKYIFKYLYKAIIQSRECTLNKIQMVNQLYQENSLEVEQDSYFNFFFWCHNKSTKLSLYLLTLYHSNNNNNGYVVPPYFKNLTEACSVSSNRSVSHVLNDLDISKFNFTLIKDATFDYILEQFGRVKIFKKHSVYFLNIHRNDLYIKTLKEYMELNKDNNNKSDSSKMDIQNDNSDSEDLDYSDDSLFEEWMNHLCVFISCCNDIEEIQEILDLKIKNFDYQRVLEQSVEENNYLVFKYIVDNFKFVKEKENIEPLDFSVLFDFLNPKFLKYLSDNHLSLLELSFSIHLSNIQKTYWFTNIEFSELLMKHFPNIFKIDGDVCKKLSQIRGLNLLNYYHQNGYIKESSDEINNLINKSQINNHY